ncbi:hypothetical protein N431DRAFT_219849 [Stipitochalara longipes BDJ]|nr:hypothetical protein N431DRAFT_219849 [Stipitochalara longipes BDJ]
MKIAIETKRAPSRDRCDSQGQCRQSRAERNLNQNNTTQQNLQLPQYQTRQVTANAGVFRRTDWRLLLISIAFSSEGSSTRTLGEKAIWGTSNAGPRSCCGTLHRDKIKELCSHSPLFSTRVPALQHSASVEASSEGRKVPTAPLARSGRAAMSAVGRIIMCLGQSPDIFPCRAASWLSTCSRWRSRPSAS